MHRYIIRRLILLFPVLIALTLIVFLLVQMSPTDPVIAFFGQQATANPKLMEEMRRKLGLDLPVYMQYFIYLQNIFKGNLGWSIHNSRPVMEDLSQFFSATLELTLFALAISLIVGIPLGVMSAGKKDTILDHFVRVFSLGGTSIPIFWMALMLQLVFYSRLGWFPIGGRIDVTITFTNPVKHITGLFVLDSLLTGNLIALQNCLYHMVLPATALAYRAMALITRMTRASMLDVLGQDYVRTARASGFRERIVIYRYVLKNAMLPIITVIGLTFGQLLQGSFLTEAIFHWPGIGLYATESIEFNDHMPILGLALVTTIFYVFINLICDILYTHVDPRIRY